MTPDRRVTRAARAREILEDELVVEALRKMEGELVRAWLKTDSRDAQGRELAWMGMKAIDLFRTQFQRLVTDGKLAQSDIEAREREALRH